MTAEKLINDHINFANSIACKQFTKTPPCVQLDELKSAAYMGLVDAANKYNGDRDFPLYASYRIYGEIKDYLRSLHWGGKNQRINVGSLIEDHSEECVSDIEDVFEDVCGNLQKQNKQILRFYLVERLTLQEISDKVGLSVTRIHQIKEKSLEQVRENY